MILGLRRRVFVFWTVFAALMLPLTVFLACMEYRAWRVSSIREAVSNAGGLAYCRVEGAPEYAPDWLRQHWWREVEMVHAWAEADMDRLIEEVRRIPDSVALDLGFTRYPPVDLLLFRSLDPDDDNWADRDRRALMAMEQLAGVPTLTQLRITCHHLDDAKFRAISALKRLERLDVEAIDMEPEGLKYLNCLENLRALSLHGIPGTDSHWILLRCEALEELHLLNAGLASEQMTLLLSHHPNLNTLRFGRAEMEPEELDALRIRYPGVAIISCEVSPNPFGENPGL